MNRPSPDLQLRHAGSRWCMAWLRPMRRALGRALAALALVWCAGLPFTPAVAQGVDLNSLDLEQDEQSLTLAYSARLTLSPAVEEALRRGVPMYFTAEATLNRDRWYWYDQRVASVRRTWRVAYQPLTAAWRVSLGGLSQVYASLPEALGPLSRVSGWRLAKRENIEAGERYHVDFSLRLDRAQLPPPMQIDVGNDYRLGVERVLRLE